MSAQTDTVCIQIPLMRSLIKDVERGIILDSILTVRDSIDKEKDLQISVLDTVAKKKDVQISLLKERVHQRTEELNLSYVDLNIERKKVDKRERVIIVSVAIAIIEFIIIIAK